MRLVKYTHACVRLERDGAVLVIDPGTFSEREALAGADAVLVTHEHFDHLDADAVRAACAGNPELRVYTNAELAAKLDGGVPVTAVGVGEEFVAAGFTVRAYGGEHAEVYAGLPGIANLGYLVEEAVYHPGDSFMVPDAWVRVLLVPVAAPWLKIAESIELVRAVKPELAVPIHDALLTEPGFAIVDNWLTTQGGADYRRLTPAEPLEV
jgi:L-ascorbate metabolism protein UlaG (beta-lactamase superfamily)